jgi:hypothetical protein
LVVEDGKELRLTTTSWLGSVWSLRGGDNLLIGQVLAIEGELVTLSVIGLEGETPDGVEVLPSEEPGRALARVRSATLLERWKRIAAAVPA